MVKYIDWDELKNFKLKTDRSVSFEDVLTAIDNGGLLDDINHPNQTHYPNQKVLVVLIDDYVYLVPYVEDSVKIFLKTIYPSRKMTKKYFEERSK